MLKLHYKDLLHLRKILSGDHDTKTDYLLAVVNKEIDKIPGWMIPFAARTEQEDIFLCTERDIEDRVHRLWKSGAAARGFKMLIYFPHPFLSDATYNRLTRLIQVKSSSRQDMRILLPNDAEVHLVSGKQERRGWSVDMALVFSYDDGPSA